jgi:hypothetical protein
MDLQSFYLNNKSLKFSGGLLKQLNTHIKPLSTHECLEGQEIKYTNNYKRLNT